MEKPSPSEQHRLAQSPGESQSLSQTGSLWPSLGQPAVAKAQGTQNVQLGRRVGVGGGWVGGLSGTKRKAPMQGTSQRSLHHGSHEHPNTLEFLSTKRSIFSY